MSTPAEWAPLVTTITAVLGVIAAAWRWAVRNAGKNRADILDANILMRKELREENARLRKENDEQYERIRRLQRERDAAEDQTRALERKLAGAIEDLQRIEELRNMRFQLNKADPGTVVPPSVVETQRLENGP